MVRVGGGWQALDEFLLKNDPCRGMYSPFIYFHHLIIENLLKKCSFIIHSTKKSQFYESLTNKINLSSLQRCHAMIFSRSYKNKGDLTS